MSKKKAAKLKVIKPARPKPKPEKKAAKVFTGKPLPIHLGLAAAVERQYGVPRWLTLLAAATGSLFGTACPATNNVCGIMAHGTEQKDGNGVAWFTKIPFCFDRFGLICQRLKLDYKKPDECIKSLKKRCPKIDTIPYKQFMEAK